MKNFITKIIFILFLGFGTQNIQAMQFNIEHKKNVFSERRQTNMFDAMLSTISAQVINDYIMQNPEKLSLVESACFGIGSWLVAELAETIYKEVYKVIKKENLRDAFGKTEILGLEIDNQRLLRRILTLIPLSLSLYFYKNINN
jgi:hypothetical protein